MRPTFPFTLFSFARRFFSRAPLSLALLLLMLGAPVAAAETAPPSWRGKTPGTGWWGPDRLWRCRDTLVFTILDEQGTGFTLQADMRDMNIYMGGDAPVQLTLVGPSGDLLFNQLVKDASAETDASRCDGINDLWLDIRYREWHRVHSPGGVPTGKTRSPLLGNPGQLPAVTVPIRVPAAGKGLYRLLVVGSQDNWIALTPDRPLKLGVHGGPGPFYLNPSFLKEAWLYTPTGTLDLGLAIHEEEAPFQWKLTAEADGKTLGQIAPQNRYNFTVLRQVGEGRALRLAFSGETPGAYLHVRGAPALLCPDEATAVAIRGGLAQGPGGRLYAHGYQRVLLEWAMGLPADDLAVNVELPQAASGLPVEIDGEGSKKKMTLGHVKPLLAAQNLSPSSPDYGAFDVKALEAGSFSFWIDPGDFLAAVAAFAHPDNPYFGHPALVRRVALYKTMRNLLTQTNYFWFHAGADAPVTLKPDGDIGGIWDVGLRSNWYEMHDGRHAKCLRELGEAARWALPAEVQKAWFDSLVTWAVGRYNMRQGECTNQWAVGLKEMAEVWACSREYVVRETLLHQVEKICTPGVLGRSNPDDYGKTESTRLRPGNLAADTGRIGSGAMAEAFGHDNEYNLETEAHLARIYDIEPRPEIAAWFDEYYALKTHLTLTRGGSAPANVFSGTCSPTDINARTRYYTHKSGLSNALKDAVRYGSLWFDKNGEAKQVWPCLEQGSFLRNIDNTYYFVKTPSYYAIVFGGAATPAFVNWSRAVREGGSFRLAGYGNSGYGQYQRKSTKIGGISAIHVAGLGPAWLGANHNAPYANTVWGRMKQPVCEVWDSELDPTMVCSGFAQGELQVDETARVFTRLERMEHAPLTVKRVVRYGESDIDVTVTVTVTATEAVELSCLYESLPVYVEERTFAVSDDPTGAAGKPFAFAEPVKAFGRDASKHACEYPTGEDPALPTVTCRSFSVRSAETGVKSGAGKGANTSQLRIVFDEPRPLSQWRPVKYRDVAAATASLNVPLPTAWKQGQSQTLHYRIVLNSE